MLFSSDIFLFGFLPIVLGLYYIVAKNNRRLQNLLLLLSSLGFYFFGEPWFVIIMIISIILNWLLALLIDKAKNHNEQYCKPLIVLALVINLGILFIFKYFVFTLKTINSLFENNLSIPAILLPIGISFFTFQAISYVIDVYRGNGIVQKNPLNVGLYIAFFPQLIAGPIVRYSTIDLQINGRVESYKKFDVGVKRFIIGLCKKVVIANTMAVIADGVFDQQITSMAVLTLWLGVLAYGLQIYFDFSGMSFSIMTSIIK